MTAPNALRSIWGKIAIKPPDECWLWTGRLNYSGYGQWDFDNKIVRPHRIVYELCKGPIPEGMEVLHTCSNRACCNPNHLEAGTHAENMKTRKSKLSSTEIEEIRRSPLNQYVLADIYGVHQSTISRIRNHERFYKNGTKL